MNQRVGPGEFAAPADLFSWLVKMLLDSHTRSMARYVILYHQQHSTDTDLTHWDLMLEKDGLLRTWKIQQQPAPGEQLTAIPLPDHRIAYLEYEGPISDDRGTVSQFDSGTYEGSVPSSTESFSVHLTGKVFHGRLLLEPHPLQPEQWQIRFPESVSDISNRPAG
ncbi:MAG: hypothetical protein GY888_08490, partial [Planctomycetaceae bacterium]|nr:hypothetical protein [Planctomycetaceae bacterium]